MHKSFFAASRLLLFLWYTELKAPHLPSPLPPQLHFFHSCTCRLKINHPSPMQHVLELTDGDQLLERHGYTNFPSAVLFLLRRPLTPFLPSTPWKTTGLSARRSLISCLAEIYALSQSKPELEGGNSNRAELGDSPRGRRKTKTKTYGRWKKTKLFFPVPFISFKKLEQRYRRQHWQHLKSFQRRKLNNC